MNRLFLMYLMDSAPEKAAIPRWQKFKAPLLVQSGLSRATSKRVSKQFKQDLTVFLKEKLGLTLSAEKTKITNTAQYARFLNYDIYVSRSQDIKRLKNGKWQRVYYGAVQLRMPQEKWAAKLLELGAIKISKDKSGKERWKAMPRGKLMNRTDIEILSRYNSEVRGLYNYYSLAGNVSTFQCI